MTTKPTDQFTANTRQEGEAEKTTDFDVLRHPLNPNVEYSQSLYDRSVETQAFWFLDAIALYLDSPTMRLAVAHDGFLSILQVWTMYAGDDVGEIEMRGSPDSAVVFHHSLPKVRFPARFLRVVASAQPDGWMLSLEGERAVFRDPVSRAEAPDDCNST